RRPASEEEVGFSPPILSSLGLKRVVCVQKRSAVRCRRGGPLWAERAVGQAAAWPHGPADAGGPFVFGRGAGPGCRVRLPPPQPRSTPAQKRRPAPVAA